MCTHEVKNETVIDILARWDWNTAGRCTFKLTRLRITHDRSGAFRRGSTRSPGFDFSLEQYFRATVLLTPFYSRSYRFRFDQRPLEKIVLQDVNFPSRILRLNGYFNKFEIKIWNKDNKRFGID